MVRVTADYSAFHGMVAEVLDRSGPDLLLRFPGLPPLHFLEDEVEEIQR